MHRSSSISITLDSDFVVLEGYTADATPATLSGHVILDLADATPLTTISLAFRGTAHVPMNDPSSADLSHSLCAYDWILLDCGAEGHRYLCPGQHSFPFSVCLGGSLPASTISSSSRTSTISYELYASALCDGSFHDLSARIPVSIVRSLPTYSLEFQQSLDVELSQPDGVSFTLALPHKAWAAGETVTCLFSASTPQKNTTVASVDLSIVEQRQVHEWHGWEDRSRVLSHRHHSFRTKSRGHSAVARRLLGACRVISRSQQEHVVQSDEHIISVLDIPLSTSADPSHAVSPVLVSHHVECTVSILGHDGRHSEIRCTLPLHVLDARLRPHVTTATRRTRMEFFGFCDDKLTGDDLPSYSAHICDCAVAASVSQSVCVSSETPSYEDAAPLPVYGLPPLDMLQSLPRYEAICSQ